MLKKSAIKAYWLYLAAGLFYLVFGYLDSRSIEIQQHDQYYFLEFASIWYLLSAIFLVFFLIAKTLNHLSDSIKTVVIVIHLVLTTMCMIWSEYSCQVKSPETYSDLSVYHIEEFKELQMNGRITFLKPIALALGFQVLFFIGYLFRLVGSFLKR
jgi:hypothetical protein